MTVEARVDQILFVALAAFMIGAIGLFVGMGRQLDADRKASEAYDRGPGFADRPVRCADGTCTSGWRKFPDNEPGVEIWQLQPTPGTLNGDLVTLTVQHRGPRVDAGK